MQRKLTLPLWMTIVMLGVSALDASAQSAAADPVPPGSLAPPGMLAALQRDLHLTPDQAITRLGREDAASRAEQQLRLDLGAGFGGAWLAPDDQRLIVAITDPNLAGLVRAQGAEPRLVTRSADQLDTLITQLDRAPAPSSVSSWYVDTPTNTVVVRVRPGAQAAAQDFVRAAAVDATAVRVETTATQPVPFYDVRGGEKYTREQLGPPCSVGFSVVGGFVTAGHCGDTGINIWGRLGGDRGTGVVGVVAGSTYPGRDYGWVDVNANWTPIPWVKYYSSQLPVYNANVAAVGASVCRSGWRTGWRCGTIKARNVTVNSTGGTVSQLTRTSACGNRGDSGGPFVSGGQAQGVLSAGHGPDEDEDGCYADTYFQPVRPILARYGLNLLVTGGSLPTVRNMTCEYHGNNTLGCVISHATQGSAQITWTVGGVPRTAWNNKTIVSGPCGGGTISGVSVTVTNSAGSWTEARTVRCEGSPM
jgi:streptogrisin C